MRNETVESDAPQFRVISTLLWLTVVNSTLIDLDNKGFKVENHKNCADNVGLSEIFLDIVSYIISNALDLLSNWAMVCGLGIDPSKTELVLFATKT